MLVFLFLAFAAVLPAQTLRAFDGRQEIRRPGIEEAVVHNGTLYGIEKNSVPAPILWILDPGGFKDEVHIAIPDTVIATIRGIGVAEDGTIFAVGGRKEAHHNDSAFVARIPPDRSRVDVVLDPDFLVDAATVDAAGVVWAVGTQKKDGNVLGYALKRFSPTGKLLTSQMIPWSPVRGVSFLAAARDRIGWLTSDGTYTEFSPTGNPIATFPLPTSKKKRPMYRSLRMGRNLEVMVQNSSGELLLLHRSDKGWDDVDRDFGFTPRFTSLFGFDGDEVLVGDFRPDGAYQVLRCVLEP